MNSKRDDLGNRMKRYEVVSQTMLTNKIPVILRIDGKAFHSFTKGFERPFDAHLSDALVQSTVSLAKVMQGFKVAYCQSDEISFLLADTDSIESCSWFDNNLSKLVSVSASIFTANFNDCIFHPAGKLAYFDARAFNVPVDDVANYFLWRRRDCYRNSVSAFGRKFFSHKQLEGKTTRDILDMLIIANHPWENEVEDRFKNGTFVFPFLLGGLGKSDRVGNTYSDVAVFLSGIVGWMMQ